MLLVPDDAKGANGFPPKSARGYSYPRDLRIRQNSQYKAFFTHARSADGRFFRLFVAKQADVMPRFGIIASKKSVGDAVQRNRCKRLLRELVRTQLHLRSLNVDMIFIARRNLSEAGLKDVVQSLPGVLKRLGV